jgi:hypothetical protein
MLSDLPRLLFAIGLYGLALWGAMDALARMFGVVWPL